VGLPAWFIRLFTTPGDLVLDPFIGSGTTAVAAIQLGRHYLGAELEPDYHRLALEAVAAAASKVQSTSSRGSVQGGLGFDSEAVSDRGTGQPDGDYEPGDTTADQSELLRV